MNVDPHSQYTSAQHPPAPGRRAPDGSVWNGSFWELPPGGPGGPSPDQLRQRARDAARPRLDAGRSTRSDLSTTTIASILLVAAAAITAVLIDGSGQGMAPGLVATLSAGAGLVLGGVVILVQRFRMDDRSWYVARSDARSMGSGAAIGLDVLQAFLGYVPAVALTVGAAGAGERLLSLTGFACAMLVGLTLAVWVSREPLRGDGNRRNRSHEWIHEEIVGFTRRGRAARWSRFLLGVVMGVAAAATGVLVPAPAPEVGTMVGLLVIGAVAGWIFFGVQAWWDNLDRRVSKPAGREPRARTEPERPEPERGDPERLEQDRDRRTGGPVLPDPPSGHVPPW
ncbi:tripartite tricarboxylate transporter TctB family protein [Georgenia sp. Z1491]|uniref:tripartite tricarboxylate transporter TctB family protein n=1 Tax=Georgenia sp. Z1491 TaxID=3416707 RepID=UPI003CF3B9AE